MIPKNLWTYVLVNTMVLCILGSVHEEWTVEVHLTDLKDYDHCLVYADKGEAASLCSSIESECLEEIMMAGSGEPSTDHNRNNYSLVNSNSGLTMYKGELSIQTHPGNTSMAVSCTRASNESTWRPEVAWEIRRDIKEPYCFIRTKQSLQSEKFQESMKLTFSQNCAGSCSIIDECCKVRHDGIYYRSKEECVQPTSYLGDNSDHVTFVTVVAILTTLIIMLLLITVICAVAVLKTARGNTCTQRYKAPKTPTSPTTATNCKFDQSTSETVAINETQIKIED